MIRARELAQAWWEDQGQKGIWQKRFNANAYRLQVTNRFPQEWRDKQTLEHSCKDGAPIQVEHMSADQLRQQMIQAGEMTPEGRLIPQKQP
jgi:hypothetical protein